MAVLIISLAVLFVFFDKIIEHYAPNSDFTTFSNEIDTVILALDEQDDAR